MFNFAVNVQHPVQRIQPGTKQVFNKQLLQGHNKENSELVLFNEL